MWWTDCVRDGRRSRSQGGSGRRQGLTGKEVNGSAMRRSTVMCMARRARRSSFICACSEPGGAVGHGTAAGRAGIAFRWSAGLRAVRRRSPRGKASAIGRATCWLFAREAGNANVTTLLERRSRFLVLLPNPDRRPAGVAERIGTALGGLAQDLRVTVTFDRGFEFMGYPALDRGLAVTSYFCDPRSPWQKGAVENANGRLRRYLPSDAPADRLTADSLQALADRFNATPRRCLGYRTPAEVFNGRLDPTPGGAGDGSVVSH